MHECPECGQACNCDGEDVWWEEDSQEVADCMHNCEPEPEDYEEWW